MNVAVILAGGSGTRVAQDVPKQFINVYDKPIIIHTLECFQRHREIDAILCVCLSGWEEVLWANSKQYGIDKLKWVIEGGRTGHESIASGIFFLEDKLAGDDVIVLHDGVRPYISPKIITDVIKSCRERGNGVSAIRFQETIVSTKNGESGKSCIDKEDIMRVMTPQAYRYEKLLWAYKEAKKRGINDSTYANTLIIELGEEVYFSMGSSMNIKITTPEDVEIFKALYATKQESWMK